MDENWGESFRSGSIKGAYSYQSILMLLNHVWVFWCQHRVTLLSSVEDSSSKWYVFSFFKKTNKLVFHLLHFMTGSQNKLVWKECLEDISPHICTHSKNLGSWLWYVTLCHAQISSGCLWGLEILQHALGNLFQCLTTFIVKNILWLSIKNFLFCMFCPFPLICLVCTW